MNLKKECLYEIQGFEKMLLDVLGVLLVFTIINVNCVTWEVKLEHAYDLRNLMSIVKVETALRVLF